MYHAWNASLACITPLGWEIREGSETIRVMNNHILSKTIKFRVSNLYNNLDFAAISFYRYYHWKANKIGKDVFPENLLSEILKKLS